MTVLAATQTLALGPSWLDPAVIIESLGPWALVGVAAIIFAECGLLLGFFLPGDSLLFTAGLFVAQGAIGVPLWLVCLVLVVSAFAGNAVGYGIGYRAGPAIFDKPRSKLFNPKHVDKTHEFFERYGNRAIVLARFVPIVRTFITVSAGVARMDPRRYLTYSLIGGVAWAAGVTVLGYFLGQFAFVREHIDLILIAIVLVSVLPIVFEVIRARSKRGADAGGAAAVGATAAGAAAATVTGRAADDDPATVQMPAVGRPGPAAQDGAPRSHPAPRPDAAPQAHRAPQPGVQPGPGAQPPRNGTGEPPYRHSTGRPPMAPRHER
ncbi:MULTISPECIES: VTT domain-containing protein [unclassified Pseudonocardia]|uniref:DedA family protein n=1 Tax=unclassified Pseudonocardia TaxID=2619320 RepID=UPI00095EA5E5|nr:DedA protein [Pseudonocardia sp. Ae707_Ps1]